MKWHFWGAACIVNPNGCIIMVKVCWWCYQVRLIRNVRIWSGMRTERVWGVARFQFVIEKGSVHLALVEPKLQCTFVHYHGKVVRKSFHLKAQELKHKLGQVVVLSLPEVHPVTVSQLRLLSSAALGTADYPGGGWVSEGQRETGRGLVSRARI